MQERSAEHDDVLPAAGAAQFSTVHALRGLAALWVVLFHAFSFRALAGSSLESWPLLTRYLFEDGRGGVAIFFVISGFVISHSLREAQVNLAFIGLFMARRSIRLDPPYWLSMIVVVTLAYATARSQGTPFEPPGAATVVAHLLYLQELFRLPEILVVYWTLTYEIQFYLVLVLALWWYQAWRRRSNGAPMVAAIVPLGLGVAAFVAAAQNQEWVLHGLFLNYWHAFVAGCLAYVGGVRRHNSLALLLIPLAALMLFSAPGTAEVFNSPAALTALFLLVVGRKRALSRGLNWHGWQMLGTISYSLYLLHIPVIIVTTSILTRLLGRSEVTSPIILVGVVGSCVAAAGLFWRVVELPTHRLAKSFRVRRHASSQLEDQ